MSIIFVFGPCWNNLQTLINTINNNILIVPNFKCIYIATNDINVFNYFQELNNIKIKCYNFSDNEGHQTSCFRSVINGMHMVIDNDHDNDDDIVIFSHEDVYINDISLFNNSISKFKKGVDIVCRIYEGTKKGEILNEIGDIISDLFIFFPLLIYEKENLYLIVIFLCFSIINEFAGILGKAVSGNRQYDGPMGKSDRAFVIGLYGLLSFFSIGFGKYSSWIFLVINILILISTITRIKKTLK